MRGSINGHVGGIYSTVKIVHGPSPVKSPAKPVSKVVQVASSIGVTLRRSIDCHVGDIHSKVEIVHGPIPLKLPAKQVSKVV